MQQPLTFGPNYQTIHVGRIITLKQPLALDSGSILPSPTIAYETTGTLNPEKNNAILVCHGLTGDQYATQTHPVTSKPGWWEGFIGPGKPIDTDKYYVITPNVLGGCMGTIGPKSMNPETGEVYNLNFPIITIGDMVRAQAMLLDHLGIDTLAAVIGGSMGGMHVLEWAASYPQRIKAAIPIATAARHTAQNIAFHEIGRQAIMADPEWKGGNYLNERSFPVKGLSVARMTAHVTYLSESGLERKFDRRLQEREEITFGFDADFQIESYLRYQGMTFVERFDPNSYLYITRAMDYFDLPTQHGSLEAAFRGSTARFCIISFSSDWLFPTEESRRITQALAGTKADVSFVEIETDKGHDAFLLDEPEFHKTVQGFLAQQAEDLGL